MSEPQVPPPLPQTQVLPYATPIGAVASNDVWQEGRTIAARQNATLPPRCVKCNRPVDGPPMRRTYYWHEPALFLLILPGILVYVIVALIVRQKGVVHVFVCPGHRKLRIIGALAATILGFGGVGLVIWGAATGAREEIVVSGVVLFIAGIICAATMRLLYPKRIDKWVVWLSGGGRDFVQSLPTYGAMHQPNPFPSPYSTP